MTYKKVKIIGLKVRQHGSGKSELFAFRNTQEDKDKYYLYLPDYSEADSAPWFLEHIRRVFLGPIGIGRYPLYESIPLPKQKKLQAKVVGLYGDSTRASAKDAIIMYFPMLDTMGVFIKFEGD